MLGMLLLFNLLLLGVLVIEVPKVVKLRTSMDGRFRGDITENLIIEAEIFESLGVNSLRNRGLTLKLFKIFIRFIQVMDDHILRVVDQPVSPSFETLRSNNLLVRSHIARPFAIGTDGEFFAI